MQILSRILAVGFLFALVCVLTVAVFPSLAADKAVCEAVERSRIKPYRDGTYSLDNKPIGGPNDSLFWDSWFDTNHVVIWGPENRSLCAIAPIKLRDGRLLVSSGGESVHYPYAVSNFVDLSKWVMIRRSRYPQPAITPGPALNYARLHSTAALLYDGRVLIVGGSGKFPGYQSIPAAEIYDPKTNKFTLTGKLNYPRRNCVATALKDGRVLIMGGYVNDHVRVTQAEVFDPRTGVFKEVGPMCVPRYRHAAVVLDDGRVMIIGGCSLVSKGLEDPPLLEYFNPMKNKFEPGSELARGANAPSAIKLADGRVLMFGGSSWATATPRSGPITEMQGYFGSSGAMIITPDKSQ